MITDKPYIWSAISLEGISDTGIIRAESKKNVWKQLQARGYYKISIETVARDKLSVALDNKELTYILDSLVSILDAGISIKEALDLLVNDKRSNIIRFIFLNLRKTLHDGLSLEEAFSSMSPVFPEFFIAMVRLSEKSGRLRQGLHDLKLYYQQREERRQDLAKLLRYPKIVFSTMVILSLGVIIFIVPMFRNVYALFDDDLPFLTHIIVQISSFFHQYTIYILIFCFVTVGTAYLPVGRQFHPAVWLLRRFRRMIQSREDPYLYAHAMALLLESGQSVIQATKQATACMSPKNQPHGQMLTEKLNAGLGFSEAFQELQWFSDIFLQFMKPAEQTGLLKVGFEQIYTYIDRMRSVRFERWSRFIEPVLMLILGAVTLTLLLSIYLPVFDLGNRIN